MAKKILTVMKVQAMGGAATPAPPLGPALSQHGVNIAQFVNDFNNATQDRRGEVVPAVLTIYEDRSYSFELKTAPTAELIKKAAGIKKGSGKPNTEKIGSITKAQLAEIAEVKIPDLNTDDVEMAMNIVAGTCRQMGVDIK
ncbi:50S ribosomal protein L11 [Candidatus Uhrbacteria bacterium]|jgi:large subunit ribosomal protein L11|nr:50S ribosomal protein L11 [Candidatus Uhrbacteria bacterium]MBT7717541.1 50S ribosomal protein L11 [Candidatus Uhrbacteria bacterium]